MYLIKFSKMAEKDKKMLKRAGLEKKAKELLNIIAQNPFQTPPPYEKLLGNLEGNYSGRINIQLNILRWRSHQISWNRAMESVIESQSSDGGSHDLCRGSQ